MSAHWIRRDLEGGYFHIQEFDIVLIVLVFGIIGLSAAFLIGRSMVFAPAQPCIQEVKQLERFTRATSIRSRDPGTMYHDSETELPVCTRTVE